MEQATDVGHAQAAKPTSPKAGTGQNGSLDDKASDAQAADATADQSESKDVATVLSELRRENQSLRRRLRSAEGSSDEQTATLRDQVESLSTQLREREERDRAREQKEQDREVRLAALTAATKLRFRNPELAYRLIERGAVTFNKDGEPTNVENLLKGVLDGNDYLAAGDGDFGGGERGGGTPVANDMNTLIRRRGK